MSVPSLSCCSVADRHRSMARCCAAYLVHGDAESLSDDLHDADVRLRCSARRQHTPDTTHPTSDGRHHTQDTMHHKSFIRLLASHIRHQTHRTFPTLHLPRSTSQPHHRITASRAANTGARHAGGPDARAASRRPRA
eukprot:3937305-Rhodomonas_salina.9